jgi:predicted RNA-binding protein with PUA-like domain
MAYWLFKSEPDAFSWSDLVSRGDKGEPWTGVRNFLARNNMKKMELGDLGFFYHSNEGKDVVGICEVIALAHPDATADTSMWECVDVKAVAPVPKPVTLAAVKANPKLAGMSLVTSARLSVQPVTPEEWAEVCRMGGLDPAKFKPKASGAAKGSPAKKSVPAKKSAKSTPPKSKRA